MIECRWSPMIIDRLADELDEERAILLEQHLVECSSCKTEDRELRHLLGAAGPIENGTAGPGLLASLLPEVRRNRQAVSESPRAAIGFFGRLRFSFPAYAAVLLALGTAAAGFWIGRSHSPTQVEKPTTPTAISPKAEERNAPGSLGFAIARQDAMGLPYPVNGDSL